MIDGVDTTFLSFFMFGWLMEWTLLMDGVDSLRVVDSLDGWSVRTLLVDGVDVHTTLLE